MPRCAHLALTPGPTPPHCTRHPQAPLAYKGVVFNEMKGVYSSPDSVNGRVTQQALFPDNTYAEVGA